MKLKEMHTTSKALNRAWGPHEPRNRAVIAQGITICERHNLQNPEVRPRQSERLVTYD